MSTVNIITRACAVIVAVLGAAGLSAWFGELSPLALLGQSRWPMQPGTALLLTLFGGAVFLAAGAPLSRAARLAGSAVALGGVLTGLLALLVSHTPMSPGVAACFVLAGLSLLCTVNAPEASSRWLVAGFWLAAPLGFASVVFLLAHLFEVPLPYGGSLVLPALTTSIALAALAAGLVALTGPRAWALPRQRVDSASLRASRSFMLVFVVMALAIVTAGGMYSRRHTADYREAVERQLSAVAELKASELRNWREERLGDAKAVYHNVYFARLVRHALENPRDAETRTEIHHWLQQLQEAHGYGKISLFDSEGVALLSVPGNVAAPPARELTHPIPHTGQLVLQDFHRHEAGGAPRLSLLASIIDRTDGRRPLGFLTFEIDPRKYLYPLIERWPTPSATAETLLVRRDGNYVLHLSELRFRKDSALSLRFPLTRTDLPEARAALGQQGIVEGIDYRGVPVIAALRPVPDTPWDLVAQVDTAEVIEPLAESLWMTAVLIGTVLLAAGTVLALKGRHQLIRHYDERLRTLEEMQQSESRYREMFEANPHPMWVFDTETLRFLAVNDAAAAHYGYSREEFGKLTIADIRPAQDVPQLLDALADKRELKTFTSVRHRKKDGSLFDVEITAHAFNFGGRRAEMVLAHDVTERKRAEETAREAALMREAIFEQSPVGIVVLDSDTGVAIDYNAVAHDDLGYAREEFGRLKVADYEGMESREQIATRAARVLRDGRDSFDTLHRTKTGELRNVRVMMRVLEISGRRYLYCIYQDITERVRLEQTQVRLLGILDATPDFVSTADAQRRVTYLNPAARKLLGLGRDDDISHAGPASCPQWSAKLVTEVGIPAAIRDGIWRGESMFIDATGREIPTAQTIIAHRDSSGAVEYISAVCRDMTEYKRTEAALQQELARHKETAQELLNARLRLAEADRRESIGRLAAGVAHEVKNPLAIIRLGIDYLARQPACGSDNAEVLEDVRQAGDRANRIISELLNFSRQKPLERRPARVEEIVDNAIKFLNHEIVLREITVARYYDSAPPIAVDPDLLEQVFINLLLNAIQAIGQAGRIEVVTRSIYVNERDVQPDEMKMFEIGERIVLVEIKDNGPGIAPEHMQKLFDPFFTTKPTGEGTGLGLAVSRNIVMMHGGFISLSNRPERGASALVALRAAGERVAQ